MSALAGEPLVTPLRTMNNAYYFETCAYTPEENMMPFKLAENFMFGGYGYADGNFNVVIMVILYCRIKRVNGDG